MKRRRAGLVNPPRAAAHTIAPANEVSPETVGVAGTEWVERAKLPAHRTPLDLPLLELECLKILWQLGEAPVWQIREILSRRRALAYTTVETLMNRLVKKGAVARRKQGAVYLYWPQYTREEACQHALQRLIDHFFYGSRESLEAYLGGKRMELVMATPRISQAQRQPSLPAARAAAERRKAAKPSVSKLEPEPTGETIETSLL